MIGLVDVRACRQFRICPLSTLKVHYSIEQMQMGEIALESSQYDCRGSRLSSPVMPRCETDADWSMSAQPRCPCCQQKQPWHKVICAIKNIP